MGEAKDRLNLSRRIRLEQPQCIFCGGVRPSETVDHYPPIVMFDRRQRPKDLLFGACKGCNEGSRKADLIAAFLSRIFPDSDSELVRAEVSRLAKKVLNIPGFADEVYPEWNQLGVLSRLGGTAHALPSWHFLRINSGPIVSGAMEIFGCKLALAMHYATTGQIIPPEGAIAATWYSNLQAFQGELPVEFLQLLGPGRTLTQGKFEVSRQFRVASVVGENGRLSGHFAVFREAFGIVMFAAADASMMLREYARSPGFFRAPSQE